MPTIKLAASRFTIDAEHSPFGNGGSSAPATDSRQFGCELPSRVGVPRVEYEITMTQTGGVAA
jgi:hypothetical protein